MKIAKYYLIVDKNWQGHSEVYGGFSAKWKAKLYYFKNFRASDGWVLGFHDTMRFLRQIRKKRALFFLGK